MATYAINASGTNFPSSIVPNDIIVLNNTHTGRSGNIRTWTVPISGTYRIEAWGAQGGGPSGGRGARIRGEFDLQQGDIIRILVGQKGSASSTGINASGGGGTFVTKYPHNTVSSILVIAGGGGAARTFGSQEHGRSEKSGGRGYNGVTSFGGDNGSGGFLQNNTLGPGGGFLSDGEGTAPTRGIAYINGGHGGSSHIDGGSSHIDGGFGGGGAAIPSLNYRMGGGGGYSGGGIARNHPSSRAGGGGSYNNGTNQFNNSGIKTGHGEIRITVISAPSVPRFPNNILVITNPTINGATFSARLEHQGSPHATKHGFEISTNPEFN